MNDGDTALAAGFAAPDEAAWRALVDKTLDGGDFAERLVSETYDGVTIQPLYTAANGTGPLSIGAPVAHANGRWDLRVRVDQPDPVAANRIALEELNGGASSLLLALDPTGDAGIAVASAADLEVVLEGVLVDLATVALEAPTLGATAGRWLLDIGERRTLRPKLALHQDPLSALALLGEGAVEAEIAAATALAVRGIAETTLLASGGVVHEAGGGEAAELGFAMASVLAYARAASEAGLGPAAAFQATAVSLSADSDYFLTLAKFRAARALLARITQAVCGRAVPMVIEARSSRRMLAKLDPWVNMLRLTAAGFGAAVGGADAIVLDPFSQPLGRSTAFARRQSRNTQLVLMEESHLGRVADPSAGSWYVEALSRDLATQAWTFMQRIEAVGGAAKALESGLIADAVAQTRAVRAADIAARKVGIVGVSQFPNLSQSGVDLEPVDPTPFAKPAPVRSATGPLSRCPPLMGWRASGPFEALHSRVNALKPPPVAYLAILGTTDDYSRGETEATNIFESVGIGVVRGAPGDYNIAISPIVVLCSSPASYVDDLKTWLAPLKVNAGTSVVLSGAPYNGPGLDGSIETIRGGTTDLTDFLDWAIRCWEMGWSPQAPSDAP